MLQSRTTKHALNIIERPLARNKLDIPTVSLSAFAYLFSELISYAMDRSGSITELEDRWGTCMVPVQQPTLFNMPAAALLINMQAAAPRRIRICHNTPWQHPSSTSTCSTPHQHASNSTPTEQLPCSCDLPACVRILQLQLLCRICHTRHAPQTFPALFMIPAPSLPSSPHPRRCPPLHPACQIGPRWV
jgi:hypothetical protein